MNSALRDIFIERFPADKVIGRHLKANRRWGSHDRRLFAEGVYDLTRWYRRLAHAAGAHGFSNEAFARVIEAWALLNDVSLDQNLNSFGFSKEGTQQRYHDPNLKRAVRESIPDWLDHLGEAELGRAWTDALPTLNSIAPVYIRSNRLKTTPEELRQALRDEKLESDLAGGDALELKQRASVFNSKAFQSGLFEMQDLHSQKVAPALELKPGLRVIDACAGGGGKALHAAALMNNKGKVLALDVAPKKLEKLRERATRAGATSIEIRAIESSKTIKRLKESADRVLLDVPCSGLGVLRRNPDSKWKLSEAEVARVTQLQHEILTSYSQMVKPGGLLVYATCSILPTENGAQVKRFMSQNEAGWNLEFEESFLPQLNGGDGFYLARLRKS